MSYRNLGALLAREGITRERVGDLLGMTADNFGLKLRERIPLTVPEVKRIQAAFFPSASLDYLCESDGDVPSEQEEHLATLDAIKDILDEIDASPELYEVLAKMRAEALGDGGEA